MREDEERRLRQAGLAFFGGITAAQSHEVTNVLSTINELAGLQEDIIAAGQQSQPADVERLKRAAGKIRNQVQRGQSIVRAINRFAHAVDRPRCSCDLREVLEQITCLAERPARLAKTALEQEYPEKPISLETDPFGLSQAVYICIEIALTASAEVRRIGVSYQVLAGGAEITITSGDAIPATPDALEKRDHLGLLMRGLGGKVVASPAGDDEHRLTLFVPRHAPNTPGSTPVPDSQRAEDTHACMLTGFYWLTTRLNSWRLLPRECVPGGSM